jgi:DNA repair exonuclease SbcCD ATPase subunit
MLQPGENEPPRHTAQSTLNAARSLGDSHVKDPLHAGQEREWQRALIERDMNERRYRSHTPPFRDRDHIARATAALENIRLHQAHARYGVPERVSMPMPPPMLREVTVVKTFTHHQDAFLSDLQAEVNELRM